MMTTPELKEQIQNEIIKLVIRRMNVNDDECHRYDWLRSRQSIQATHTQLARQLELDKFISDRQINLMDCQQIVSNLETKLSTFKFSSPEQVLLFTQNILKQHIQEYKMYNILREITNEKKDKLENISKGVKDKINTRRFSPVDMDYRSPSRSGSFFSSCIDTSTLHI